MTTDISSRPYPRFQFPVIGDLTTIDFNKPVQKVTAELRKLGSGMIEQPIGRCSPSGRASRTHEQLTITHAGGFS